MRERQARRAQTLAALDGVRRLAQMDNSMACLPDLLLRGSGAARGRDRSWLAAAGYRVLPADHHDS
jgi:hypothetical protein